MASNQTAMDALINEMVRDVEYHERYKALKTLIDQARRRKDIPEYKRLYKELMVKILRSTQSLLKTD